MFRYLKKFKKLLYKSIGRSKVTLSLKIVSTKSIDRSKSTSLRCLNVKYIYLLNEFTCTYVARESGRERTRGGVI